MKKLICIIMSAIIIIMLFMPSFTICAADTNESKKITEFTNGIADLARKYDSEKEFVTPEGNETGQIQFFRVKIQKKSQIALKLNILYRTFRQPD